MKGAIILFLLFCSFDSLAQVLVKGRVVDENQKPIPYVTIAFQDQTDSKPLLGVFSNMEGKFETQLPSGQYLITFQMVGYHNLQVEQSILADLNMNMLVLTENVEHLKEVVIRAERSYIESDLGKKTLHIGSDLANAGGTAVDAIESLPSVTTDLNGNVSVRGSENVIIYVNGRETKRDPKTLQFVSAEALKKIELITNPSAKYDAEGVAGIINLVYAKTNDTKLEVFATGSAPFRASIGGNASISSDRLTFFLNASERRSLFENSDDQIRLTPADSLRRYENRLFSDGEGLTREINIGLTYEPDTSFSVGLEANYLKWDDDAGQFQRGLFNYENESTNTIELQNGWLEIEDELSIVLSSEKKFSHGQLLSFQSTVGGENETNEANFNTANADLSGTPVEGSIRSSRETESQRYLQSKLDYSHPLGRDVTLSLGGVLDMFDLNVDQELVFFVEETIDNRFQIDMRKYAAYAEIEKKKKRFEFAVGLRYERFSATSLQEATDSTFEQKFKNLFPSVQWKYTIGRNSSVGFNFTRRINRPSFWEVSPFLSYSDPLNLETGNPYLQPEFAYLFDLTYSTTIGNLGFDLTAFRRTTEGVIQRITSQLNENQFLVSYDNIGARHDDGVEWSSSLDLAKSITLEATASAYRTRFREERNVVFYSGRWNWQSRLKQRFRFKKDWAIDLVQYYRAPQYGAQSFSLPQYYLNASIQKSLTNRGSVTLSLRDILNSRLFGHQVEGEDFELENKYKFQTRVLSLSLRYKLID